MKYKRVLLKLSGEHFAGAGDRLLNFKNATTIAKSLQTMVKKGWQVGIVLGAGNIFRGRMVASNEIPMESAHYMGMMGTRTSFRAGNLQSDCIKVKEWLVRQDWNLG